MSSKLSHETPTENNLRASSVVSFSNSQREKIVVLEILSAVPQTQLQWKKNSSVPQILPSTPQSKRNDTARQQAK